MVTSSQANSYLTIYRSAYEPVFRDGEKTAVGVRPIDGISFTGKRAADAALWALREACVGLAVSATRRSYERIDEATREAILDDAVANKSFSFDIDGTATFAWWLSGVVENDAAKERDRAHNRYDEAHSPLPEENNAERPMFSAFDAPDDAHWSSQSSDIGDAEAFAQGILAVVRRLASERYPEEADLVVEIAANRNLEAALDGRPLEARKTVAERHGVSEWRARSLTDRATALVTEVAQSFRTELADDRASNHDLAPVSLSGKEIA